MRATSLEVLEDTAVTEVLLARSSPIPLFHDAPRERLCPQAERNADAGAVGAVGGPLPGCWARCAGQGAGRGAARGAQSGRIRSVGPIGGRSVRNTPFILDPGSTMFIPRWGAPSVGLPSQSG